MEGNTRARFRIHLNYHNLRHKTMEYLRLGSLKFLHSDPTVFQLLLPLTENDFCKSL